MGVAQPHSNSIQLPTDLQCAGTITKINPHDRAGFGCEYPRFFNKFQRHARDKGVGETQELGAKKLEVEKGVD